MTKKANASIVISSDTKSVEKGIAKVSKEIKGLGDSAKKNSITSLAFGLNQVAQLTGTVANAFKKVNAAINDMTDAYKVQANAETLLETAARNNPYLNGANVTNLKNYASQLQSISVYGDEQLLPMMAQLAAAGRTEEQIMKIMSASIDVAVVSVDPCFPFDTPINISYNERKQGATPPCALLHQKFDKPLYNFKNQHQQCYLVRS